MPRPGQPAEDSVLAGLGARERLCAHDEANPLCIERGDAARGHPGPGPCHFGCWLDRRLPPQ
eukprot:4989443-Alexandrium_andersonii.AAC.1